MLFYFASAVPLLLFGSTPSFSNTLPSYQGGQGIKYTVQTHGVIQFKKTNRSTLVLGAKLTAVVIQTNAMGKLSLRLSALECSYESSLQASSDCEYF